MSDTALTWQEEEHVSPERAVEVGAFENGVRLFEARVPRARIGKHDDEMRSDWYASCPVCGWRDHQPDLPRLRRHAREHSCLVG